MLGVNNFIWIIFKRFFIMVLNFPIQIRKRSTKTFIGILLALLFMYTFFAMRSDYHYIAMREVTDDHALSVHKATVAKFYKARQSWSTSVLGTRLFKPNEESMETIQQSKIFTILVWKYWDWLKKRHVMAYGEGKNNPLKDCSVKNCLFTGADDLLETADAVIIHLQHGIVPKSNHRPPQQRWIFLSDESPKNSFSLAKNSVNLKDFANVFNWSMTFRSDSDIPVPYGRTVALETPFFKYLKQTTITEIIPNWKKKRRDVIATILISNCSVKFRMKFLTELQKHIPVDIYGNCSQNTTLKHSCPGHFRSDCEPISKYLFYLTLENSNCQEYLTEKIWHHAYGKGAIPVIMGPSIKDCKKLLPPNSYLHIPLANTPNQVKKLAMTMLRISKSDGEIASLHNWRNHFKVVNEHGYFATQSKHLCRVCEAMNYNNPEQKIYTIENLLRYFDPKLTCDK